MAKVIEQTTKKMSQLCRKIVQVDVRWGMIQRVSFVGQFFRFIWNKLMVCSVGRSQYKRLSLNIASSSSSSPPSPAAVDDGFRQEQRESNNGYESDSDLVNLKISLLGDCHIGKTTFLIKYVGNEVEKRSLQMEGLNLMDKTLYVQGARISFCIWDVAGDKKSLDQIPMACKDAVALLIMFDLTSRSTLNNVVGWYTEARKWNQTAIPILIGTKFDDFVRLPPDVQWTIVTQSQNRSRTFEDHVREKSPKEPRKWNRLWDYKDVHNVMSENMETENLEAIVLRCYPYEIDEIQAMSTLRADSLAQMNGLKFLILWDLNFSGSLNFLSSELGYLCWDKYPFTCLPSSFEPDKLVEQILPRSNIRQLWEGTKPLHNLTHLDLSHSKNLIMMPSFLEIPNLEHLDLEGCIKLVQIDPSIGTLRRLLTLNLKNCTNLVSIPNRIFCLSSLKSLNLSGCPNFWSLNLSGCPNFWLEGQRKIEHLGMLENNEITTQYQPTSFIYKFLKSSFRFFNFNKSRDPIGLLLPLMSRLSCLQHLDLSFCNLPQIPNAIGWLHCLETLNLGGNNFVTLPSIKELFKLRELNLEHCKQLKYLRELPSKSVLPVRETYYGRTVVLNIFGCPSLTDIECCYRMVLSWMIQLLQVHMKSDLPIRQIEIHIVIPRMQIPMWFNKQNVGSSISMGPLPNMDDKNFIGVACCITFVAHDDQTSLGYEMSPSMIGFGIKVKERVWYCSNIDIHHGKDLVTVDLQHLCQIFITRETFIDGTNHITEGLHDIIELEVFVYRPRGSHGLHLEVKNCGYRWIYQEDLDQLNSQMYLPND